MSMFTNKLEWLMLQNHKTWANVCQDTGLGKNSLAYWKQNNTIPNKRIIDTLADYFHVTPETLLSTMTPSEQQALTDNNKLLVGGLPAVDKLFLSKFQQLTPAAKLEVLVIMETFLGEK